MQVDTAELSGHTLINVGIAQSRRNTPPPPEEELVHEEENQLPALPTIKQTTQFKIRTILIHPAITTDLQNTIMLGAVFIQPQ